MKTFLACIFTFLLFSSFAQQSTALTLFCNGFSIRNPAATGLLFKHNFAATGRTQWVGINGAPRTINALYDYRWNKAHGGIGINYEEAEIGFNRHHRINLNYAYHVSFSETNKLSFGAALSFIQFGMKPKWIAPQTLLDNSLPVGFKINSLDLNLGIMYKADKFSIGFSANQVLRPRIKVANSDSTYSYFQYARHYYLHSSYNFHISKNFELIPSILIITDLIKLSTNVNLRAIYKKQFWIGASYRTSDTVSCMAGVDWKQKYRVCYAYDFTIGKLASISKGSHEIGIAVMLK